MVWLPWIVFALAAIGIAALLWPHPATSEGSPEGAAQAGERRTPGVALPRPVETRPASRERVTIRERLRHAGFYKENLLPVLRVIRVILLAAVVAGGWLLSLSGVVSLQVGLMLGMLGAGIATIAPGWYLDHLKVRRQQMIRRAIPDALDVIVISLEGGLPVAASFQRVSIELANSHPLLALEMKIVQREVQMGRSLGQGLQNFAERFDLDDLRNMASVIEQSERYGVGVTRAFRIFATGLRRKRMQQAEELARKTAIKLMFPTVIFIFPVMFVVILAPAIIRMIEVLGSLKETRMP